MGPYFRRGLGLFCLPAFCAASALAQSPGRCAASANPSVVRAEGLAERTGDILLQCTGLNPGATITGNFTIFLPVSISNRVDAAGRTTEITVAANGSPLAVAGQVSGQSVVFPLNLTVPPGGALDLRISNLRAAASQLGTGSQATLTAFLSFPPLALPSPQVTLAITQRSLLAARGSAAIACFGSELPANLSYSNLIAAGVPVASTRLTEGFANAFEARSPATDSGTRFLLRFSGFPAGARLVVPNYVAGGDALQPTRAGDLGGDPSVGVYQPGSGALLLARVNGADANGAGGFPLPLAAIDGPLAFESVTTISPVGGAAAVTYEVLDASPSLRQSAQVPVFLGIPPGSAGALAHQQLSLAPLAASGAVPRFDDVVPPEDCVILADCELLLPQLEVNLYPNPLRFTAVAGGNVADPGNIGTRNVGGGIMRVEFSLQYVGSATGWITLDPPYATTGKRLFFNTKGLAPGTYQANVTVNAFEAGSQTVPVTLVITAAPPPNPNPNPNPNPAPNPTPVAPKPLVTRIVNGASREAAPVVSGSFFLVQGANFSGNALAVTFDGLPARIIGSNANEISVRAPELGAKTASLVVVTVDGQSSNPHFVSVALAWPAIFAGGVLNQDNSVNSETNGAAAGSEIQIFATGLPASASGVTIQIHDRKNLAPVYAGSPPDSAVQQVNVVVPSDLPAMTTYVSVCGAGAASEQFCSPGAPITIR